MKERPILFSGEMVRAILDGRKTMTRRVVKSNRNDGSFLVVEYEKGKLWPYHSIDGESFDATGNGEEISIDIPYGMPGDRLWVRETFAEGLSNKEGIAYRATSKWYDFEDGTPESFKEIKWKPSIFMPRWASRITLEITNVRVERLQDISEEDAKREGANGEKYRGQGFEHCIYREAFRTLWESINAKRGYSWESNPWVWVIEFERIKEQGRGQ